MWASKESSVALLSYTATTDITDDGGAHGISAHQRFQSDVGSTESAPRWVVACIYISMCEISDIDVSSNVIALKKPVTPNE